MFSLDMLKYFTGLTSFIEHFVNKGHTVATSPVMLRWLCDSPRMGCAWRITPLCMWREQAITEWSRRVISVVACCHRAKLCEHGARDFRSQQNGAVTRMWRSCGVQPSHKEHAIGVVRCEKEGMLLTCGANNKQ